MQREHVCGHTAKHLSASVGCGCSRTLLQQAAMVCSASMLVSVLGANAFMQHLLI